ncbi:hypothetical protein SGUI_2737 [Serinicoccus hydrothermalis]|uniref:Uncharacterized protein n=1 Tax=Serinicoccus hydrothermalis TaxID=1758689 RepID=A0A1B1NFF6_9MICO|nr:hypothetical protein SGUI_2737 [Serinicoccus hydrothermalis]
MGPPLGEVVSALTLPTLASPGPPRLLNCRRASARRRSGRGGHPRAARRLDRHE